MESDKEFDLRNKYDFLKKEYKLPDFEKLSEDFDIEKLAEKEPQFLLREIRRMITDKFSAYLNLFEMIINPISTPMFILSALRGIEEEDRLVSKEVYKEISKFQIRAMKLDTNYEESFEASFIKDAFEVWQNLKKKILLIVECFEKGLEKDNGSKKGNYLG